LVCEQCETENGSFFATELDITNCRKIENARGRLVCSARETPPAPVDPPKDEAPKDDANNDDAHDDNNIADIKPDKSVKADNNDDGLQHDDEDQKINDDANPPEKTIDDEPDENAPDDGLPAGTYRTDCSGCKLKREGLLLACDSCKRDNGLSQYTVAYVSGCKFFVNRNGVLRCDKTHS